MADLVGMENELCIDGAGLRFISKGDHKEKYLSNFLICFQDFLIQ